jgi:hypothetical protein
VDEEVGHDGGVGAELEQLVEIAHVIAVVVGQEHPTDVLGLDEGEDLREPVLSVHGRAGVDHDGLSAADEHRVRGHIDPRAGGGEVGDQPGVGGDAVRTGGGDGGEHLEPLLC